MFLPSGEWFTQITDRKFSDWPSLFYTVWSNLHLSSTQMKKDFDLSEEDFNRFLHWLDPDRETAARKYKGIQTKLINILNARCCPISDDLVDQAFDQTIRRLPHIIDTFRGEPSSYIYVVAKNL